MVNECKSSLGYLGGSRSGLTNGTWMRKRLATMSADTEMSKNNHLFIDCVQTVHIVTINYSNFMDILDLDLFISNPAGIGFCQISIEISSQN